MFVWVERQPTGFEKKADRRLKESFNGGASSKKLRVQPDFEHVDFSESSLDLYFLLFCFV